MNKKTILANLFLSFLLLFSVASFAQGFKQSTDQKLETELATKLDEGDLAELQEAQQQQEDAVVQLTDIQQSLKYKISERRDLRLKIRRAGDDASQPLLDELDDINNEIELLERTFEQIAIGGIDLSVFGIKEEEFNWREELILIVKPLIENIKGLTEKPRKLESLRRFIGDREIAKDASSEAIQSIAQLKDDATSKPVLGKLQEIEDEWKSRVEDLDREIQLAQYQLESLEGKNIPWFEIIRQGAFEFVSGRGLTLLLVVFTAGFVWFVMRGLLWLIQKRSSGSRDRDVRVRYRLAAYAYRILTGLLIAIAVMMVLYFRQDLLLLAVMVVILVGLALALKNLLPKYIAESRLLLNMGGVREKERLIFNGVPWEVSSINMHSRLTNPEIRGGIRLPIGQMHDLISRSGYGETWFPSSEGDWILDESGDPAKVVRQTVDIVELQDVNSVCRTMPTAEYFQAGYANISRVEEGFRVAATFGIDYATQKENVEKIESAFKQGLAEAFEEAPFADLMMDVSAEFHSAGDSSLNYIMLTRFKPEGAEFYNRIKRRIQRACVMVCSENDWGIPFPQLSVHLPAAKGSPAAKGLPDAKGPDATNKE